MKISRLFINIFLLLTFNIKSIEQNTSGWTPSSEQLYRINTYQRAGLTFEDQENIIQFIKENSYLTTEQAISQYRMIKLQKKSIEELLKLAAPLKFVATAFFLSNIYSLIKPFIEPFIQKHIGKYIFKNSIQPEKASVTFNDIAGYKKIKKEVKMLIRKMKNQQKDKLEKIDGVLFYGAPGCGKSLFAEAIANEAGVNFFNIKASDLINEEGNFADRIKLLFEKIRAYTENFGPSILFIDEIDLLVANRSNGKLDNNEKIVLQDLLSLLGGQKSLKGVLVIGNTNYINAIDIALLRNGRLGNHIEFKLPNNDDIKEICLKAFKDLNLKIDINFSIDELAEKLLGKNVAHIIQIIQNIKDFIIEHKYQNSINTELINEYEIENSL